MIEVGGWYQIREIARNLYWVKEPGHVSFYLFKDGGNGLMIDSGLGLSDSLADELLNTLGIERFDVLCTHAHCDHVGLNYRAQRIFISQAEWEKYQRQGEKDQLQHYAQALGKTKRWPVDLSQIVTSQRPPWQPSAFLVD